MPGRLRTPLLSNVPLVLGILLTLGLAPSRAIAGSFTITVPTDEPTIQGAIDLAVDGDVVVVEPGTYFENLDFLGKAIIVQSLEGSESTFIDGGLLTAGPEAGSVVRFANGETSSAILSGFTLMGGTGTLVSGERRGGAIYCAEASPLLSDLHIVGNTADVGGGVATFDIPSPSIVSCRIEDNDAIEGGGVYVNNSGPVITSTEIVGNSAADGGGTYLFFLANAFLVNVTITGNSATGQGGAAYIELFSEPSFDNSILWGNSAAASPEIFTNGASPQVWYSDIAGGWSGIGGNNFDIDPMFVDTLADDYRLQATSPLIDVGNNDASFLPALDRAGGPRVTCTVVDLGAYEAPAPAGGCALSFVRSDCNVDGTTNIGDALEILGFLALAEPVDCTIACDANGDDAVDIADAVNVLNALFVPGSSSPPPPFPDCSISPGSTLGCDQFDICL